jgi:hypothetical protein
LITAGITLAMALWVQGCTTPQTFADPPSHCALTAEGLFWALANVAVHGLAGNGQAAP